MGTQRSSDGPGDTISLLPQWALKPLPPPVPPATTPEAPNSDAKPDEAKPAPTAPTAPAQPSPIVTRPKQHWRSARSAFRKAVESSSRDNWRAAARSYVSARGGSKTAAASSAAGRRATATFASFLGNVATRGLNETLRTIGLERLIGGDALTVVAAVANAICPLGGSVDAAVARQSTTEVLAWLYDKYASTEDGLARLEKLGQPELAEAVGESVTRYIFNRWLEELGKKIEDRSVSPEYAVRIERDVLDFVRESVKLDFAGQALLTIDWQSTSAAQLIESIYGDAYRMLE